MSEKEARQIKPLGAELTSVLKDLSSEYSNKAKVAHRKYNVAGDELEEKYRLKKSLIDRLLNMGNIGDNV